MTEMFLTALAWFNAIGCGVMAGVYFTFSVFVMRSLAAIGPAAGMTAMQSINDVIVKSAFLPLFFATSLASLAAMIAFLLAPDFPGRTSLALAGGLYFFGMFVCTVVFNVPLNNQLAAEDANSSAGELMWEKYLRVWTRWNHLRTVASTVACVLFIRAI